MAVIRPSQRIHVQELMPVIADRPLALTVAALPTERSGYVSSRSRRIKTARSMTRWDTKRSDENSGIIYQGPDHAAGADRDCGRIGRGTGGEAHKLRRSARPTTARNFSGYRGYAEALKAIEERNKTKSKPKSKIDPPAQKDAKDEKQQREKESAEPAAYVTASLAGSGHHATADSDGGKCHDTPPDADEQELEQEDSRRR